MTSLFHPHDEPWCYNEVNFDLLSHSSYGTHSFDELHTEIGITADDIMIEVPADETNDVSVVASGDSACEFTAGWVSGMRIMDAL